MPGVYSEMYSFVLVSAAIFGLACANNAPNIEKMMLESSHNATVEALWPWHYPESACIGELWYTPLVSWFGQFNRYWWSDFNVIAFNNILDEDRNGCSDSVSATGLECGFKIGGRAFACNDFRITTEGSVGHDTQTNRGELPYVAVIGGDFCFPAGAGNFFPKTENLFVGGEVCSTTPQYIQNRIRGRCHGFFSGGCLAIACNKALWYYRTVQTVWAFHPANVVNDLRTEWDGKVLILTATISNLNRYYITLPISVFDRLKAYELIGFPDDAEFVVTVHLDTTKSLLLSNIGKWPTLTGDYPGRVVFSFVGDGEITISESRLPSVIAPRATINQRSGRIEGFAVANTFNEIGTVHIVDCTDSSKKMDVRNKMMWA